MIPKKIHYCWFGHNPLPPLANKCIQSWKKYLPEYEIIEWNESNFDVNSIPYIKEAYNAKKYAFVSDYARFWILYNYGGLYFDTDVEVIKNMDHIIEEGAFMGCESDITNNSNYITVAPGLGLGAFPKMPLYKEIIDVYKGLHFINNDGSLNLKTVVNYTTEILEKYGLKNSKDRQYIKNIWIYPKEYFNPKSYKDDTIIITPKTVSIHHYSDSWKSPVEKVKIYLQRKILGKRLTKLIVYLKHKFTIKCF